jgi:hypothetical protein
MGSSLMHSCGDSHRRTAAVDLVQAIPHRAGCWFLPSLFDEMSCRNIS